MGKGVRILSEVNVWASVGLLLLFFILGPTAFMLGMVISGFERLHLEFRFPWASWIDPDPERQWQSWWTIFYWGWWIAWCPFVGLFIARISKGSHNPAILPMRALAADDALSSCGWAHSAPPRPGVDLFGSGGIVDAVNNDYATGVFETIAGFGYDSLTDTNNDFGHHFTGRPGS